MVSGWQRIPLPSPTQPLKSICHNKFGAGLSKRCEARGEPAGATTRPCRRKISCTVESAGRLHPLAFETARDLARTPGRMCVPYLQHQSFHCRIAARRARMRPARAIAKVPVAANPAGKPLVARIGVDPEPTAQLPPVRALLLCQSNKLTPLVHNRYLSPRHGWPPCCRIHAMMKCRVCLRTGVGYVPGLNNLTRRSIFSAKIFAKAMDARVKPAHDAGERSLQSGGKLGLFPSPLPCGEGLGVGVVVIWPGMSSSISPRVDTRRHLASCVWLRACPDEWNQSCGKLGLLPPPLWGRAGEGGSCCFARSVRQLPPPPPTPPHKARGRGAHRLRSNCLASKRTGRAPTLTPRAPASRREARRHSGRPAHAAPGRRCRDTKRHASPPACAD